jgi:tRNA(Ile)-lysidine synthase
MIKRLKDHIESSFPFLEDKQLLITCSGGVDSVVMSYLFKSLNYKFSIAHCNFSLRGEESDLDEEFVSDLADKLSVPVFKNTFDTRSFADKNNISIQMAARELRYDWFKSLIQEHSIDYILTAHHLDDDLETFFINLSRGTGLRGLTGIPEINDRIIRPLLIFHKKEIMDFAIAKDLKWREDQSNAQTDYLRNQVRHELIPEFLKLNDSALMNFRRTKDHLNDSIGLIDDYLLLISNLICKENQDGIYIDIDNLKDLTHTQALLYELLSPYGFTAWEDIADLLNAQSGKTIYSFSHRLIKDRNHLILSDIERADDLNEFIIVESDEEVYSPIHLTMEAVKSIGNKSKRSIFIDKGKVNYPLKIRTWKEGDSFYPFGMEGKKKLSKLFKDEKLSLLAKEKIRVLLSNDQIVWVVGLRPDDRFKVDDSTKEIIKITWID